MYLALAKDAYQVRATLLDSRTVIERAVRFIDNTRSLTTKNKNQTLGSGTHISTTQTQIEKGEKENVSTKPK